MDENPQAPPPCGQCGKPSVVQVGSGAILCVDCYTRFAAAIAVEKQQLAAQINFTLAEMESIVGMPGVNPRIRMPGPPSPVLTGPVAFHNIHVDRSIVGAINTGEVQRIDISLTNIRHGGNDEAAKALATLTEAVLSEKALDEAARKELIEQVAFLAEQAAAAAANRKPGLIRSVLGGIKQVAGTVEGIGKAWVVAAPILHQIFGV